MPRTFDRMGDIDLTLTVSKELATELRKNRWISPWALAKIKEYVDGGGDPALLENPYRSSIVWYAGAGLIPPPLGSTGLERCSTLIDFVLAHEWPPPATLSAVQSVATELKKEAAAREAEADRTFQKFEAIVPPPYNAIADVAYKAFKAAGRLLNSNPGDSDEAQAALGAAWNDVLGSGFPPPWALMKTSISATAETLTGIVRTWLDTCRGLPSDERDALRAWWASWLFYAQDSTFEKLYSSPLESSYGAVTDGLVVLVAAPFAKVSGQDFATFAGALWEKATPKGTQVESLASLALTGQTMANLFPAAGASSATFDADGHLTRLPADTPGSLAYRVKVALEQQEKERRAR